ncbi:MAG: hypothetical protein JRG72_00200 [Deltaproteobacteria bacterium]|nr:hypothetical protein [Deltaproteobacteria bacterium]
MGRFFDLHDPVEKKYIFNSFIILVIIVELLIFLVTLIWQIDAGVFSEQVTVVPFPWKEYLVAAFTAPIVMMFLFGLIVKGFDTFNSSSETLPKDQQARRYHWLACKWSRVSYLLGLVFLISVIYALVRLDRVLPILRQIFTFLGLWATYLVIGVLALGLLYFPLNLILRYRLQKKAMEYQYLLHMAERQARVLDNAAEHLTPTADDPNQPHLDSPPESSSPSLEDHRKQ